MSFGKITILGVIGQDATVKNINGKDYMSFSVAVSNGKDAQGNQRESTWYSVLYGLTDKNNWLLERLVAKSLVHLEGKPVVDAYVNKENKAVGSINVWARSLEPLGIPQKSNTPQGQGQQAPAPETSYDNPPYPEDEENMPF